MQDIRIGGGPPAHADPAMGQTGHGPYGHAGPAFPTAGKPHFATTPDGPHLSPVDSYRKQHEITVTVSSYSLIACLWLLSSLSCNVL